MSRSYEQTCFVARALDVLGERWTLLIVRELVLGPRRYGDLLDALAGIGTNLLAARLKHLERHNVLYRKPLPGPGRAAAYALTDRGEALIPVLASLAEWGAGLEEPPVDYSSRAAWGVVAMRITASEQAADFDTVTEMVIGEETLWLQGDGKRVRVETGPAPVKPGLRLVADRAPFYALARGQVTVRDAITAGDLNLEGDTGTAELFFELFSFPDPTPPLG
ncbi:winged helix-turn-helix transcriptional regulator [Streptomyces chartreusis]|uniref:winged helix-turn-helix transcriptional regulator n=1 Tax=Streptomyces chartreusis TaxID=1969 RepID=UPI003D942684